jgi:DNA mismatch endonuclease (patch repair protein)
MHSCRLGRVIPKTNAIFWKNKRLKNKERDKKNNQALRSGGWKVLTLWACQLKNTSKMSKILVDFLRR